MTTKNWASAKYQGLGKDGKGFVTTQSKALSDQPYGFNTRFEDGNGTNPEEQIAAAHASCFAMALSFALAGEGFSVGELNTKATVSLEKDGEGFTVTHSALELSAKVKGINEEDFLQAANGAKANCPISKLLNCDISLDVKDFTSI